VIKRFQIEDIIVQDTAGVTFRAVDTATHTLVAVRRFFPFGADGGGLQKEEEVAYGISIGRLAGVRHPQLRAVITGGCDPIDAIPYIATEWIDGTLLSEIVRVGPLSAEDATHLVSKALEVCELLSQILAEEAIWVETELHTIVVANPPDGRGATFWISPLKWLGRTRAHGYDAIVDMVEEALGWKGRIVSDHAGRGLGAWLKWLRTVPATMPLREVRESLAAAVGVDPPVVVFENPGAGLISKAPTVRRTTQRMIPSAENPPPVKNRAKWLLWVILASVPALAGGTIWWFGHDNLPPPPQQHSAPGKSARPMSAQEKLNLRIAELKTIAAEKSPPEAPANAAPVEGVIPWDKREFLVGCDKRTVTISGRVSKTKKSKTGKTIYLLFSDDPHSARVGMSLGSDGREAVEKRFESLVGRNVESTGTVKFNATIGNRPEITISSLDDLKSQD
jgi:hypothetical protein